MNIVKGTWTMALDPGLTPTKKESENLTMSVCQMNEYKPFEWRDKYPTSETESEVKHQVGKNGVIFSVDPRTNRDVYRLSH